jgi:hypothetical protein
LRKSILFLCFLFFTLFCLAAQDSSLLDVDIDALFDEPLPDEAAQEEKDNKSSVVSGLKKTGLYISAGYEFQGGIAPGWDDEWAFSWAPGVKLGSTVGLDAQISEVFRVRSVFKYYIPPYKPSFVFTLGDFFFDYNVYDAVFVRAGKYEQSWGISPNFGFTNLLARVPDIGPYGTSYIAKADIPIGIGGIQVLALTRADIIGGNMPTRENVGFGGKFNLAFRWADFDLGAFYQKEMATRSIFTIKTTILDTELYNEWLLAVNTHSDNAASFAFNVGFAREFFGRKLELNGELFYNGEGYTYFYTPEEEFIQEETTPFMEGLNIAFNLLFRFSGRANPRFFTRLLYAPMQDSVRLIPGFRLSPLQHIDIYLAVPMALGNKDGYYYQHTADPSSYNRPFCIMFYITLKGAVQAAYYY